MADTQETIADIIAEKRREANYIVQVAQGKCHIRRDKAEDEARDIRREADRLEAAHKRERGDCAKLREALKLCMDEMCSRCRDLAAARSNLLPCLQGCEPVRKAKAALAAPPRNCDRFATKFDAKHEWEKVCKVGLPEQGPFEDWLFAPAAEKEGGNNG